ncbi:MAG: hypothetical protein WC568_12435 [Candidatus Methanoperedens sp.]
MENANMNLIFTEIKKIREDLDYLKKVVEFGIDDIILTDDEEKLIKDTLSQKKKGELLTLEEVFGE